MKKILVWALVFAWVWQTMPVRLMAETAKPKRKPYVAVMDFEAGEGIMKGLNRAVTDKVREGLMSTRKYVIIDRANIQMIMSELAFGQTGICDQSCAVQVGRALSAHFIITGRITQLGPEECQVSGQMTDVERTEIVRSASERCSCTATEIIASAETVAFAMAGVEARRGTLVIQSTPKAAVVYVDGDKKGSTPTNVKVKPGSHKVMVAAKGYKMQERAITMAPGATQSLNFKLEKEKKKWYATWWFYTLVGVAAAGGVAAAASGSSSSGGGGEKSGSSTGTLTIIGPSY